MKRQQHEPPTAARYNLRAVAVAVFYAFLAVGAILTAIIPLLLH